MRQAVAIVVILLVAFAAAPARAQGCHINNMVGRLVISPTPDDLNDVRAVAIAFAEHEGFAFSELVRPQNWRWTGFLSVQLIRCPITVVIGYFPWVNQVNVFLYEDQSTADLSGLQADLQSALRAQWPQTAPWHMVPGLPDTYSPH